MDAMVGTNLKFHRDQRAWTQEDLAAVSGIDVRTIQRGERGEHLSGESLRALASAFDLTVEDLRQPPKPIADAARRFKIIRLSRLTRAVDLRDSLPAGSWLVSADGVTGDAQEDAIAAFQRDLDDTGNIWSDLDPVQRLDCLRSMDHHIETLSGFGLIVAVGSDSMRLRSEHMPNPFTIDVLHVVISNASDPKLFALRDRTLPCSFSQPERGVARRRSRARAPDRILLSSSERARRRRA